MRILALLGLAVALLGEPGSAAGQTMAKDRPAAQEAPAPRHPPGGLGGTLMIGGAGMPDLPTGWVARLEYEIFPVLAPAGIPGMIFGFQIGWEFWRTKPDWGLALPIAIVLGVRAQPVRATVGFGFEGFLVDVVDDDTGFGLYAPLACARVGADVFGFQLGADARVIRRWQFGAPDHTQWQLGAFIGGTWESKYRGRRY